MSACLPVYNRGFKIRSFYKYSIQIYSAGTSQHKNDVTNALTHVTQAEKMLRNHWRRLLRGFFTGIIDLIDEIQTAFATR